MSKFKPRFASKPKKNLQCPSCAHEHNHKRNVLLHTNGKIDGFLCHHCHTLYHRPYEPSVYVFDKVSGSITVVTP